MTGRRFFPYSIFIVSSVVLLTGCGAPPRVTPTGPAPVGRPTVRVLLPFTDTLYTIDGSGRFIVQGTAADGGEVMYYCSKPVTIKLAGCLWELAEQEKVILETSLVRISIHSRDPDDHVLINGKPYPGSLLCCAPETEEGAPQISNRAYVDDYLLGVLPPELGRRTREEFEAVKAQAVAARTYALSHLGQYPGKEYDLRADHLDQIYIGLQTPGTLIKKAIRQTSGEVLRANGELIEAYYHSTCGGYTDDITSVWDKEPQSYLVMTEDDTFCNWSTYAAWTEVWDAPTLHKNLVTYLQTIPDAPFDSFSHVFSLRTEGRTPGGRVQQLVIETDRGSWIIHADKIRI